MCLIGLSVCWLVACVLVCAFNVRSVCLRVYMFVCFSVIVLARCLVVCPSVVVCLCCWSLCDDVVRACGWCSVCLCFVMCAGFFVYRFGFVRFDD